MEQKWFQEDTRTAVWSALVSKRFMGRNDSSCRSWAGLRERKKNIHPSPIFLRNNIIYHLKGITRSYFLLEGRFRVYWGFCPDNPSGGEWSERDEERTSLPRAPHMPALTFEPRCARNLNPEVTTSRPPFWPAECLTPFSQKVKQFAPAPDDLSPRLVPLRYESTLTSVAFISSPCY